MKEGDRQVERQASRRRLFLKGLAALGALPLLGRATSGGLFAASADSEWERIDRSQVRALLISATTLAGRGSLEHAREHLRELYGGAREILLINFASLPEDRDAYEARMRRDFRQIDPNYQLRSLHRIPRSEAAAAVRAADAFFVSGGNTFLLLRELYDRYIVELLRERVLNGAAYAGSSAGSNIAGTVIGTTNDFPLTDIPTRRALGILPAVFNPHHPNADEDESGFVSRRWKIGQYTRYHPTETVIGVTNPGMVKIQGDSLILLGQAAKAFLRRADREAVVQSEGPADLASVFRQVQAG